MSAIKKYFEWDITTWSRAKPVWDNALYAQEYKNAIDIGSRRGGLSLYLAKEFRLNVICSDLKGPTDEALKLHQSEGVAERVSYAAIDCTAIPYENNHFDVVIFKSVLGALGSYELQKKAIDEMHRVLKPGGVLLFAENLEATTMHMFLRKKMVKWSMYWRYPRLADMHEFLSDFETKKIESTGFLAIFCPEGGLKKFAAAVDNLIAPILPARNRYVAYGYAKK